MSLQPPLPSKLSIQQIVIHELAIGLSIADFALRQQIPYNRTRTMTVPDLGVDLIISLSPGIICCSCYHVSTGHHRSDALGDPGA